MVPDETNDILRDIRKWIKVLGLKEAKPLLRDALSDPDDDTQRDLKIAYHLTNGENGVRAIAEHVDYSRTWVGNRHTEWANMGLIERENSNSSYQHIIGLDEAGMEVPDIPDPGERDDDS